MTYNKKLTILTILYWLLLLYIIAALVWWFVSLESQNRQMFDVKVAELKKDDLQYETQLNLLQEISYRKHIQYIGEGVTFLLIIIVVSVFIYRVAKKQLQFSRQQQNFMMAVTHELKTPVAIIHLNLETIQKRKLETARQEKLISTTIQETNRLNTLCNNILTSSQLESGEYILYKQNVSLSDLVNECISEYKNRFPQCNIVNSIEQSIFVFGESNLLKLLISNLLDNAIKYSPKESSITVTLNNKDEKKILAIADEGVGISNEEKKKIFRKFYRAGNEEIRKTKGTGLGLYLAEKIVNYHRGMIKVKDNKPKGTVFIVDF